MITTRSRVTTLKSRATRSSTQRPIDLQKSDKKMQKSEEERSAFQDVTDEMAAEFGFDLEE